MKTLVQALLATLLFGTMPSYAASVSSGPAASEEASSPHARVERVFASLDEIHHIQPTWRKAVMPAETWANGQFDKRATAVLNATPDTLNFTGGLMLYLGGMVAVNELDLRRAAVKFEAGYALGCLVCGAALATVLDLDPTRLPVDPVLAQDWNDLAAHAGVTSAAGELVNVQPRSYDRLISGDGATLPTTTGSKDAAAILTRAYALGDAHTLSIVDRAKAGETRAAGLLKDAGVDPNALPEVTSTIVNRLTATLAETGQERAQDIETLTVRAESGDPTALLALGVRQFPDAGLAFSAEDRSDFMIEAAMRGSPIAMAAFADSVLSAGRNSGYSDADAAVFAFAAWVITPSGDPNEEHFRGILDGLTEKLDPKLRKAMQAWFKQTAKPLDHSYP